MYVKLTTESGRKFAINVPTSYQLEEVRLGNGAMGTKIKSYGENAEVKDPDLGQVEHTKTTPFNQDSFKMDLF